MKGLTEKQRNILNFIEDFMEVNVMAPTVYEIAEHFKIKTSTVFAHLRSLQKKNYMTRSSKARSISLTRPRSKTRRPTGICSIPFYEKNGIRSSRPLYCDSALLKDILDFRKLFAVKVPDNSLTRSGIFGGDIAILKKISPENLHDDDIVLVELDGRPVLRSFRDLSAEHAVLTDPAKGETALRQDGKELPVRGILVGVQRTL